MNDIQIYNHWVNQNLVSHCRCYNNPEIIKFSIGELHILLNSSGFHEHTVCKSHTLLKALKYLVLIISISLDSVTWHLILEVYPHCCSEVVSCLETSTLSHTLLKSLKECLPVISTFLLQSMLYISDSQPGVHAPPEVQTRIFRGTWKKFNNSGKRHIRQHCKTRYNSKVVKLIDIMTNGRVNFLLYLTSRKAPFPCFVILANGRDNNINYKHFANMKGTIYRSRLPRGMQVKRDWELLLYILYRRIKCNGVKQLWTWWKSMQWTAVF